MASPGESVTSRALRVLAAFEHTGTPLSLADIVAQTGLPRSTAHRMLGELEQWGAVQRDAHGRYQIGLRLWELGQHAGVKLRDVARPYLQDLFGLTQDTVHIAIREGAEVLYIDRVYGSRRVPQASRVGGRLPVHATAVGKVILAFEEEWVRDAVLDGPLEQRTSRTETDPVKLRRELEAIRHRGYAQTSEEVRVGSCSLAVPFFQKDGRIFGGLGVVLPIDRANELERSLPSLIGTARRIELGIANLPVSALRSNARSH
ncbi:IclR family transcriptional regulator [Subtercola sp. PAMC28395]|uniref:IclR family transcriptional regulator n=1 Tax=Subtercola sp. PAMC28395 TaxID=2846775 RepID=UPI00209B5A39|nr:IclR family transcriptional regulator [Subtercola sp. PAMC28395]